jgi:flagellin
MSAADFTVSNISKRGAGSAAAKGLFVDATAPATTGPTTLTAKDTSAAEQAITSIANAVSRLGVVQGKIGTAQNKISYAIQLAQSQITSFSAAESRIRDADVASEAANLTKAQVLQQASLAALAQANSAPQAVLSLLRG